MPDHTPASVSPDDIEAFGASLRGALVTPDSDDYDAARLIWNGMFDKKPALIARCSGTADVIAAVSFAREHDVQLSIRDRANEPLTRDDQEPGRRPQSDDRTDTRA